MAATASVAQMSAATSGLFVVYPHIAALMRALLLSAADSHPADPPAMAVPETLGHPFATAKIVVWPGTCAVRGGHTIAARSRDARSDATLCAYGRRGKRTSDRGHRDEGSKCLPHFRGLLQDGAFGQRRWTVNPSG